MSGKSRKAIGYCRVATVKQSGQSISLDIQKRQIAEAAQRLNIEIVEWFAQTGNRSVDHPYPVLDSALQYCKSNPDIKYLFVVRLNRLARSLEYAGYWKVVFERIGVTIKTSDNTEPDSPMCSFVESLSLVMAQFEHDQLSEKIRRGIQHEKAERA